MLNRQLIFALCLALFLSSGSFAAPPEAKCHGNTTRLYSNQNLDLSICHGDYVQINLAKLDQWQDCVDSMLFLTDKKTKIVSMLADCLPTKAEQFKVSKDSLLLRHFYVEYPGFSEKPLLIENTNLVTLTKQYSLLRKFPACQKSEVDQAIRQIEATRAKPFDGNTYFSAIYGSFYKLRDCANSFPTEILATLTEYSRKSVFDGEVSETLDGVIDEVRLIASAKRQN
jgi:hypothetical protein